MSSLNGFGLKPSHTSTPDRDTGSVAETEPEITSLFKRSEQFAQFDLEKSKFINVGSHLRPHLSVTDTLQELLTRIEYLSQQYETLTAERKRDYDFVSAWQAERQQYEKWFKNMNRALVTPPWRLMTNGSLSLTIC